MPCQTKFDLCVIDISTVIFSVIFAPPALLNLFFASLENSPFLLRINIYNYSTIAVFVLFLIPETIRLMLPWAIYLVIPV